MVWHQLTGVLFAHYLRAQYRSVYTAFAHHLGRIRDTVFLCFLDVSPTISCASLDGN